MFCKSCFPAAILMLKITVHQLLQIVGKFKELPMFFSDPELLPGLYWIQLKFWSSGFILDQFHLKKGNIFLSILFYLSK